MPTAQQLKNNELRRTIQTMKRFKANAGRRGVVKGQPVRFSGSAYKALGTGSGKDLMRNLTRQSQVSNEARQALNNAQKIVKSLKKPVKPTYHTNLGAIAGVGAAAIGAGKVIEKSAIRAINTINKNTQGTRLLAEEQRKNIRKYAKRGTAKRIRRATRILGN